MSAVFCVVFLVVQFLSTSQHDKRNPVVKDIPDSKVSCSEIECVKTSACSFQRACCSEEEKTFRKEAVLQLGATVLSV